MPLDHISLHVPHSKIEAVVSFLISVLGHTGFKEHLRPVSHAVGCGDGRPYLWIVGVDNTFVNEEALLQQLRGAHIAFTANSVQEVRQFHAAGLKAGGEDNGAPGHRPEYHEGYYGAFVRDPACGVNFEMVFRPNPRDEATLRRLEEEADTDATS